MDILLTACPTAEGLMFLSMGEGYQDALSRQIWATLTPVLYQGLVDSLEEAAHGRLEKDWVKEIDFDGGKVLALKVAKSPHLGVIFGMAHGERTEDGSFLPSLYHHVSFGPSCIAYVLATFGAAIYGVQRLYVPDSESNIQRPSARVS